MASLSPSVTAGGTKIDDACEECNANTDSCGDDEFFGYVDVRFVFWISTDECGDVYFGIEKFDVGGCFGFFGGGLFFGLWRTVFGWCVGQVCGGFPVFNVVFFGGFSAAFAAATVALRGSGCFAGSPDVSTDVAFSVCSNA